MKTTTAVKVERAVGTAINLFLAFVVGVNVATGNFGWAALGCLSLAGNLCSDRLVRWAVR